MKAALTKGWGLAAATVLVVCAASGHAQEYPAQPIRIIVPVSAGGGTDLTARLIGE